MVSPTLEGGNSHSMPPTLQWVHTQLRSHNPITVLYLTLASSREMSTSSLMGGRSASASAMTDLRCSSAAKRREAYMQRAILLQKSRLNDAGSSGVRTFSGRHSGKAGMPALALSSTLNWKSNVGAEPSSSLRNSTVGWTEINDCRSPKQHESSSDHVMTSYVTTLSMYYTFHVRHFPCTAFQMKLVGSEDARNGRFML